MTFLYGFLTGALVTVVAGVVWAFVNEYRGPG